MQPDKPNTQVMEQIVAELACLQSKVIVLDDDPTGTQCANGVYAYFSWDEPTVEQMFKDGNRVSFIMTNSRALSQRETRKLHRELMEAVCAVSKRLGREFFIVSRSDSTLRWNYPVETDEIASVMREHGMAPDAELICPCFFEGGRVTEHGIHFLTSNDKLVPVSQTEFARDRTFHFEHSDLTEYIVEKYENAGIAYDRARIRRVDIDLLASGDQEVIDRLFTEASGYDKLVIDSTGYRTLARTVLACLRAMRQGKRFIYRGAASFLRLLMDEPFIPLLDAAELSRGSGTGGLIVAGSHVANTTRQLERLGQAGLVQTIELDQRLALDERAFEDEVRRVSTEVSTLLEHGKSVCLQTRRERVDVPGGTEAQQLELANRIADGLVGVVDGLTVSPRYLIGKGGITSHSIGALASGGKPVTVLGQVLPGIPVWRTSSDARLPDMPYIVFPGNVGSPDDLYTIVKELETQDENR